MSETRRWTISKVPDVIEGIPCWHMEIQGPDTEEGKPVEVVPPSLLNEALEAIEEAHRCLTLIGHVPQENRREAADNVLESTRSRIRQQLSPEDSA